MGQLEGFHETLLSRYPYPSPNHRRNQAKDREVGQGRYLQIAIEILS